jgi:hypothetical protein
VQALLDGVLAILRGRQSQGRGREGVGWGATGKWSKHRRAGRFRGGGRVLPPASKMQWVHMTGN